MRRFFKNIRNVFGVCMVLLLVLLAVLAPWIAPYDPILRVASPLQNPSPEHWLGTDYLGRDVFSRVVYGSRVSLYVGFVAVSVSAVIGVAIGVTAGYFRGWAESLLMRSVDAVLAFPVLLLAIMILAFFGPGLLNVMIAVSASLIPGFARMAHGATISLSEREYIEAGKSLGASHGRVVLRHVLPNILPSIIVYFTFSIPIAILMEAGLSFLGLGVVPPTPTWGNIVNLGRNVLWEAPWISNSGGLMIMITVLGFNMLGESIASLLDPRARVQA